MRKYLLACFIVLTLFVFNGCDIGGSDDDDDDSGTAAATTSSSSGLPFSFSEVTWLYPDVSGWPETGVLSSVTVSGDSISLPYDKASVWSAVDDGKGGVNANVWVFVLQDGAWYAGTWEYLRKGQTVKAKKSVAGDHIKRAPLQNFRPQSGQQYGFMVSGLCRGGFSNVQERTNVVMYTWP